MESLETLLEKFYNGVATEKECRLLLELLNLENELKTNLEPAFSAMVEQRLKFLTEERSKEIFNQIQAKKNLAPPGPMGVERKQPERYIQLIRWAAAAAVIGIIGYTLYVTGLLSGHQQPDINEVTSTATQSSLNDTLINTGMATLTRPLEDGSEIILAPNSTVTYATHFPTSGRNIYLTGTATFKVAKDKTRPFTVYAAGTATTALGTVFSVSTLAANVQVKLIEGSIVVKSDPSSTHKIKDTYLTPGQLLSVNKMTGAIAISTEKKNTVKERTQNFKPAHREYLSKKIEFTDEPLANVLKKISTLYKLPLSFNEDDVKALTFTGSILPKDNPQKVLEIICKMNNLAIDRRGGRIVLLKNN